VSAAFDVVVVGAGPAGSAAALVTSRAGLRTCLVERGPFPGSKNMYGGVVYGRILDRLLPQWWEHAPVERWVVRRSTMVTAPGRSVSVDVRSDRWGSAPYNGATALRPAFDGWLADQAVAAGATLLTATTVTGLRRAADGAVAGVVTDRHGEEIGAPVVVACDGVNSFLAKEAGLHHHDGAEHYTLGVKEVLSLPKEEIDRRFGVEGRDGVDIEVVGCTEGVAGGGFLYTNLESVSVGVVLHLPGLAASGLRPEAIIAGMKEHPSIAPLVRGADLVEYSAHLIPEGGLDAMPEIVTDGMLVAGDAAGLTLAAGIWLEGVNFAIGSGAAAGETAVHALARGDVTAAGLQGYRTRLEQSFVLADHRKLRRVPSLLLSERVQRRYPEMACRLAEELFTVHNPAPKPGLGRLGRDELRRSGVRVRDLARDAWTAWRSYG
jgi:electron transfer flavoprotein-quinone oxidoreductase